jgi:hypothetical protein
VASGANLISPTGGARRGPAPAQLAFVLHRSWLPLALLASACATSSGTRAYIPTAAGTEPEHPSIGSRPEEWNAWPGRWQGASLGLVAARTAATLVGHASLKDAGPRAKGLPDDCTGLVRYAWNALGVDLYEGFTFHGENGVTAMYEVALERGALHRLKPAPGDLVFFRETYDRNRDGKENDGLTHVAVVESVDAEGTVTVIHRINAGIRRSAMTLAAPGVHVAPDGHELNDYLRPAGRLGPAKLTGELFVSFASPVAEHVGLVARH